MTSSIAHLLEATRTDMATYTGGQVRLGVPDGSEPGLYIFAHRFTQDFAARNLESVGMQGTVTRPICVYCLLMASPGNNYPALDEELRYLMEQPVFASDNDPVRITIEDMSARDLSRIFSGTHTTYRLAIPFLLKGG